MAGGVHSLVLTTDGVIYSCGINEKGTVPVKGLEPEEVTDRFTEIVFSSALIKLGKVSFSILDNHYFIFSQFKLQLELVLLQH